MNTPDSHTRKQVQLLVLGAVLIAGLGLVLVACQLLPPIGVVSTVEPPTAVCPMATPEFFEVAPVTSPTDALTQVISVDLGNGETITITTESGTFVAPFDTFPKEVEITLLPNTTHNLTVQGKVREITQGDCVYGGYMLETTRDRNGQPLTIEQRQP